MAATRFYRYSYFSPGKKDRDLLIHRLRDADASLEVSDVPYGQGYQYGGLLLNYPAKENRTSG
jgi:hypothetical protein